MKLSLAFVFLVAALTIQVIGKNVDGVKTVSRRISSPKKTNVKILGGRKINSTNVKNPEKNATKRNKSQKRKPVGIAMKIVRGRNVTQKKFTWMVYLEIERENGTDIDYYICGGTLIAPNWVLTAAHCVEGAVKVDASVGGINSEVDDEQNEEIQAATELHMHSKYNNTTQTNDIALVKFKEGFSINKFISIMRLPRFSYAQRTFESQKVVALGYGQTSGDGPASPNLLKVDLMVESNKKCTNALNSKIINSKICTKGNREKSICGGDSGGPLVYKEEDGIYTQIGITSAGEDKCKPRYPAIFTRVTSYLEWIVKYTKINIVP